MLLRSVAMLPEVAVALAKLATARYWEEGADGRPSDGKVSLCRTLHAFCRMPYAAPRMPFRHSGVAHSRILNVPSVPFVSARVLFWGLEWQIINFCVFQTAKLTYFFRGIELYPVIVNGLKVSRLIQEARQGSSVGIIRDCIGQVKAQNSRRSGTKAAGSDTIGGHEGSRGERGSTVTAAAYQLIESLQRRPNSSDRSVLINLQGRPS